MTPGAKAPGLCLWQIPATCCAKAEGPCWHLPPCPPREQSSLVWSQLLSFLKVFAGKPETHLFWPKNPREASAPAAERRDPVSPVLETRGACSDLGAGGKAAGPGCPKQCLDKRTAFIPVQKAREPKVRAVRSSGRVEKIRGKVRAARPLAGGRAGGAPQGLAQRGSSLQASRECSLQTVPCSREHKDPCLGSGGARGARREGPPAAPTPASRPAALGLPAARSQAASSLSNRHPNTCFSC